MQETTEKVPEPEASATAKSPKKSAFLSRHAAKCRVCNHPNRAAIEFEFIHWRNPATLAKAYHLRDLSTVYRHAHAMNLFPSRRLNVRNLMERIAERVDDVPVTATAIIRAARAISRINDAGEWIDPPTRIIISHEKPTVSEPQTVEIKKDSRAIFQPAHLEEPPLSSETADLPPLSANSKPPVPKEIILEIAPSFYAARQERNRALEANRLAKTKHDAGEETAFSGSAPSDPYATTVILAPWKTAPSGVRAPWPVVDAVEDPVADLVVDPVADPERSRRERSRGEPSRTGQPVEGNSDNSSSLPQAASQSSAPSTSCLCKGTASAVPLRPSDNSSLLPQAASQSSAPSALSVHESRATESASRPSGFVALAGSSGSSDPPYPFDFAILPRRKPWRR